MFQVVLGVVGDLGAGYHIEFLARRDVLDNAGNVSHAELAKHIRAVTAIVEDEPVFHADRVQEIGAKPNGKPNDAGEVSRRRVIGDVAGFQFHG